jgi:mono/diheme cytochrome c family protein
MERSIVIFYSTRIAPCVSATALCFLVTTACADPENGERLARHWCAACHVVASDQHQASVDVPPFATIGQMPNFSSEKLAFFLLEPHPKMPNMALTRREAADIADYVKSLGRAR